MCGGATGVAPALPHLDASLLGTLEDHRIICSATPFGDRDGVTASLGRRLIVYLPIIVVLLMTPSVWWMIGFASKHGARTAMTAGVFLTPASVLAALPAAFFFAIAMYRARADLPSTRLLPSVIAGSVTCAVVVFALLMIVVPTTNQAFRTVVYHTFQAPVTDAPRVALRKGLAELTLPELNDHIRHAPSSREEERARAQRHMRFAFTASVFVLGLLGLGIAGRWQSRWATLAQRLPSSSSSPCASGSARA